MQGKAQGEMRKAMQIKRQSDNAQAAYGLATQNLEQLHKSGADPNSDEYKNAKAAVDGSWAAMMDLYGQHVGDGKKPKAKKGAAAGAPPNPMADLNSQDPNVKAQAILTMLKKAGPPIYHNLQAYDSPEAKAQREAQAATQQAGALHATNTLTAEQAHATVNKYAGRSPEDIAKLPQNEQDDLRHATAVLTGSDTKRPGKETVQWMTGPDGKQHAFEVQGGKFVEVEGAEGMTPASKSAKPVRAFINKGGKPTSVLIDPGTNQVVPGSENPLIEPPSSLTGRVTTGFYHWTDGEGNLHAVPETRTSAPALGGRPSESVPSGGEPAPPRAPRAARAPGVPPPAAGGPAGDRVLGNKAPKHGTPEQFKQLESETTTRYEKQHGEYMKRVDAVKSAKDATPKQIQDALKHEADENEKANKAIAVSHSQQMRALGGDPGDSQNPAPASASTPPQSKNKGVVRKAAFMHENPDATEDDWKAMKSQFEQQGYQVKE